VFAREALAALVSAGHDLALVLTQPDRPAGRGLQPVPSAVKRFAAERGLELFQPATLKGEDVLGRLRAAGAEAMVVAAYGLILPEAALRTVPHALNIHASLLPRWRGAAPIQRALLAGDVKSGISVMQMDAGLDSGPVLMQEAVAIAPEDDAGTLHDRLATLGARMIVRALDELAAGCLRPAAQDASRATYAAKLAKRETALDWSRPAAELERAVRAFRPAPGAAASLNGEKLKLWATRVAQGAGSPGTVLGVGDAIVVACGTGALAITELQRAGGARMSAKQFLLGRPLGPGARFDAA